MSQKTLVLHIGMPKTGTTSIQETFGSNHKALLKAGINYPRKKPYNHANTFAPIFLSTRLNTIYFMRQHINTEVKAQKKIRDLKHYWENQFKRNREKIYIISAETLCRLTPKEISSVKEFVSSHFDNFKIVVYVRRPEAALKSLWGQHVKTLSCKQTQQELLDSTIKSYNYSFVKDWANVFGKGNIIVRPFDKKALVNGSLLDDFSVSIGSKAGFFQSDSIQNESFGRHALALIYESNLRYPLVADRAPNPEKGLSDKMRVFFRLIERVQDEKFDVDIHYSSEQANAINANIDIINEFLEPEQQFSYVYANDEPRVLPDFDEIPKEFLIDLINEYNKYIDQLLEMNLHAQVQLVNPDAGERIRRISRTIRKALTRFGLISG